MKTVKKIEYQTQNNDNGRCAGQLGDGHTSPLW